MSDTNTGRFVWYELLTSDPKAAIDFYTHVVGWKTEAFGEPPPGQEGYTMWVGGQGPLGGVMTLPEQAKQMGAPPHWMANVSVASVDDTVARAQRMGGRVYVEPSDMPSVGRFAIIADPQGASMSLVTLLQPMAAHDTTKHGEFAWNELATTDAPAALNFYGELFGWKKLDEHDMGPMGTYLLYGQDGKHYGGMFTKTKDMPMPTAWLYYVQVDDLEAAISRAKDRGARLLNGPMEVPGGTHIAQLMDPQGAAFALHSGTLKGT